MVASSSAFAEELAKLSPVPNRDEPLVFPLTCPAAFSFVVAMVAQQCGENRRIWVVADSLPIQERIAAEFHLWSDIAFVFVPEQEWQIQQGTGDPDVAAERLEALYRISAPAQHTQVVIVTAADLKQLVPDFSQGAEASVTLCTGSHDYTMEKLAELLNSHGFERCDQVTARNQWSIRGGILDIFPLQTAWPVRIEYFDDEIESIRAFDVDSQLSFRKLKQVDLLLDEPKKDTCLGDWIQPEDIVISLPGSGVAGNVLIYETPPDVADAVPELSQLTSREPLSFYPTPLGSFDSGDFVMQEARRKYVHSILLRWRKDKWRIIMFFPHSGEKQRFEEICGQDEAWDAVQARDGALPFGFTVPSARLAILSSAEIFGRHTSPRHRRALSRENKLRMAQTQSPIREIESGDLVIHATHGLGQFIGIVKHEETGEEEIHIQYAGGVRLRIPLRQAHLISKYVGLGTKTPDLNRIGDARWKRACQAAERAIADYAAQLLEVQAERESNSGYAHPVDSSWMWQFESSFPFRETPDQLRAIHQTKLDMESSRPMDRLICGDVGFGKTEVAIRAAFKCVTGGKQAALLAPTTVLADQHYRTFRERMSEYPVRIELLSRFTPARKVTQILAGLQNGEVDIVIGTHRLLSKDVVFRHLGLAIIDEEQRFGVQHKEQFKRTFRMVDMLTLSATPIPRTLYVALMGARDMSTIDTPPPNRLPVQTTVCPYNEELITRAIEMELSRKGQVFFLHNRVQSIYKMEAILRQLVPHARIVTGHGQMDKADLEKIMREFIDGKADILLSTTIIESGIDIPNANTIIIDRADRFGLADLYQLRGRVGRSAQRAYAYLLLPEEALCTGDARRRVSAIKQYTALGSGFKIAMRDLEIRGAGNLLGTQQSGHIAAIGFELYCQLLRQSIDQLRGVKPSLRVDAQVKADFLCISEASMATRADADSLLGAYIPSTYVQDTRSRMECYTRLAQAVADKDLDVLADQWKDRFGPLPDEVLHLILLQKIKIIASQHHISMVEISGQKLMLMRNNDYILINRRFPRLQKKKPADKLAETWNMLCSM